MTGAPTHPIHSAASPDAKKRTSDIDSPDPKLVLGIDTGGTFTDAVLLDYDTKQVLATRKTLTTKHDYTIGIQEVLEKVNIPDPSQVRMVSVSTTLATNAIAEGKGKPVALFLVGYDPELIQSFRLDHQFATPKFFYFQGGHDLFGEEKEPLDLEGILSKAKEVQPQVEAFAVSSYFSPLNPEHELRVQRALKSVSDLPIVLGHQLSTRLGSVERATTAALNASLLSMLQDFIVAVRRSMERRALEVPLMVVRGDGTLMSAEFAATTPVETIHSGPAASAIGGRFLAQADYGLVVDIGGTTTDFALLKDGQVTISEEGATVARFKTAVQAADLYSIGLGGDSHIHITAGANLHVGPERVVPLSTLAAQHPRVSNQLAALVHKSWSHQSADWLEYWFILRPVQGQPSHWSERERKLYSVVQGTPKPLPQIIQLMEVMHKGQLGAEELIRQEFIGKAGLTPTDLLHVEGRFTPWDVQAAEHALEVLSGILLQDKQVVIDRVWETIQRRVVSAALFFLTGLEMPKDSERDQLGRWFFDNSLRRMHPHLETSMSLIPPIIGIGAPAELLLAEAANALNTDLLLPEHFQVANAVGAVAGSVMVQEEVLVYPLLSEGGLDVLGYHVQSGKGRQTFEGQQEAIEFARESCRTRVLSAAMRSGAVDPQVEIEEQAEGIDTYRIRIKALGNPRLANQRG